ncbi:hypothetical protein D3C77_393120 [compost metagenome]
MSTNSLRANECVINGICPSCLNTSPTAAKSLICAKSIEPIHSLPSKSGNGLFVAAISSHLATDLSRSVTGKFMRLVINSSRLEGSSTKSWYSSKIVSYKPCAYSPLGLLSMGLDISQFTGSSTSSSLLSLHINGNIALERDSPLSTFKAISFVLSRKPSRT